MLAKIKNYFSSNMELALEQKPEQRIHALELATAALLIEVSRADFEMDSQELKAVYDALGRQFSIPEQELQELVNLAHSEVEESISMHQFTALVNESYNYDQKLALIESMWQVAFADGELDKYEDHLIRRVADLIYVSHGDFIKRKLKAQSATASSTENGNNP
ncbi:MAG: TerB family tellurite resistance protein [Motiliproteus sp.]|nr:TerB family tellurite resistance protein [Motiliproteus sp.]MCW9051638.1 TerB family tellurite resistance protein [Motiliproteus sp.]